MTVLNISGYDVMIDDEDVEKVTALKWRVNRSNEKRFGLYYFDHSASYKRDNGKWACRNITLHRFIMGCEHGDGNIVDHIDGNTLNCQKSNMRLCTHAENCKNARLRKDNTSGHKGVSWNKGADKWMAYINNRSERVHLGYFTSLGDAVRAYEEASLLYHGGFARREA